VADDHRALHHNQRFQGRLRRVLQGGGTFEGIAARHLDAGPRSWGPCRGRGRALRSAPPPNCLTYFAMDDANEYCPADGFGLGQESGGRFGQYQPSARRPRSHEPDCGRQTCRFALVPLATPTAWKVRRMFSELWRSGTGASTTPGLAINEWHRCGLGRRRGRLIRRSPPCSTAGWPKRSHLESAHPVHLPRSARPGCDRSGHACEPMSGWRQWARRP